MPNQFYSAGYTDALEKLAIFRFFGGPRVANPGSSARIKAMQPFSFEGVPEVPTHGGAIDQFRSQLQSGSGAAGPSASAQLAARMPKARHGLQTAQDLAAAPPVAPPDLRMAPGSAASVANKVPLPAPAGGAAPAASPGLLSGLGMKGKIGLGLGAAALVGGGLMYARHRANQRAQNAPAQQYYGPPQQQMYGAY